MKDSARDARRVLLVDGDEARRNVLCHALSCSGYEPVAAETAESALDRLESERQDGRCFGAILLDLEIRVMGGIGFLRNWQKRGYQARVVALTGQATVERTVEAMRLGVYDVLQKPASLGALRERLEGLCGSAGGKLAAELRANPGSTGTREQIARQLVVDPKTVTNRLRRQTGLGFREFMHETRVKEAERLLSSSELEVKEIDHRVGFGCYRRLLPDVRTRVPTDDGHDSAGIPSECPAV